MEWLLERLFHFALLSSTIFYIKNLLACVSSASFVSKHSVFYELLSLGIPLTLNSLSVTLLQSVQSILIPMMLYRFYGNRYRSVEIMEF